MKKIFTLFCSIFLSTVMFAQNQYVCVIAPDTFNTKSYAANDGEHTIIGSDNQAYVFTTFDIMKSTQKGAIQSRKNTGSYIAFPTNLITDSIVFNLGSATTYLNFSVKADETTKEGIKVNDSIYYVIPGSYDSLKIVNASSYTAYVKAIEVYFHEDIITSSIENNVVNNNVIKFYNNGQIYIRKNNSLYNIIGTKVK